MSAVRRPPVFDPNHSNRVASGVTGAVKSGLVAKSDKMMADLGLEGDNPALSEDESDLDEDPHARPSGDAAAKQRIARLEQELDDLAGKLSMVCCAA